MQFFDLNIPYLEGEKLVPDKLAKKQTRLKLIVKAMELGYSGIAYNRTIKGPMSESDRCTIPPFPLSSLLNVSPCLSSSVAFHRRLLGVPNSMPFRQYTRLTVLVESPPQALALNSGNSVLKTYDLVAVRPLNQISFDHACQSSQVDLISIDFSRKLPFRLKLPMVKAAIARGVCFEITYSSLMEDVQVRRQMISNAKLMVEWTRGKNLIVSSASPSVVELRGPNDVANLLSLLGLSEEHAKAAISKNCRSLIASALRKKRFYKEAIRVEVMPAGTQTDPQDPWIADYVDWDPISSGEGDLHLDDMAKSFAKSGKVSQTVKAIDFASIDSSSMPSQFSQVKGIELRVEDKAPSSDNVKEVMPSQSSQVKGIDLSVEDKAHVKEVMSTFMDVDTTNETENLWTETTGFHSSQLDQQGIDGEKSQDGMVSDLSKTLTVAESPEKSSTIQQELDISNVLGVDISPGQSHESDLQNHDAPHSEAKLICRNKRGTRRHSDLADSDDADTIRSKNVGCSCEEGYAKQQVLGVMDDGTGAVASTERQLGGQLLSSDVTLNECVLHQEIDHVSITSSTTNADKVLDMNSIANRTDTGGLLPGDFHLLEKLAKDEGQREDNSQVKIDDKELLCAHNVMQGDSFTDGHDGDKLVAKSMLPEDMVEEPRNSINEFPKIKYQSTCENKSDKQKANGSSSGNVLRFPFKRLFEVQFKKGRIPVCKTKKR